MYSPPPTPAPSKPLPALPLPLPAEKSLPKKSSLSTLRSVLGKKTSSSTLRSVRSTAHLALSSDSQAPPLPLPLPQANWRDMNLSSPKFREDQVDGCLPPMTPSRNRLPKSSIGQPHLQPSTSPSAFLETPHRRAPSTPKKDDSPPPIPGTDWAYPLPVPDLIQTPGNVTLDSPALDTPKSRVDAETPSQPLTARAAQADKAFKPKRLISLLPRQQKVNLGRQTIPTTGPSLRAKKSTGNISEILTQPILLPSRSAIGLPTPGPLPYTQQVSVPSRSRKAGRDPLGIIHRFDIPSRQPTRPEEKDAEMPFRSGAGVGWSTPGLTQGENKENDPVGYFNTFPPTSASEEPIKQRAELSAFDFSASPAKESRQAKSSDTSMESRLPSEEWELEAYLRKLEKGDRERFGEGDVDETSTFGVRDVGVGLSFESGEDGS